jgi:hypothetical protein
MRLDSDLQILLTTVEGLVTLDDIRRHLDEELRAGGIVYREVFDATAARTNLTADEVRSLVGQLTTMMRTHELGPTAVITVDDVFYGMHAWHPRRATIAACDNSDVQNATNSGWNIPLPPLSTSRSKTN